MSLSDIVTGIVALNGGKLVGKTRLQKTFYLLDRLGMETNAEFDYHNFGPFSQDLARATDFAWAEGRISKKEKIGYHNVPYTIFGTGEKAPARLGQLKAHTARKYLDFMNDYTSIDLELAATIDFLSECGVPDPDIDPNLRELKPLKATNKRLQRAHELLDGLTS